MRASIVCKKRAQICQSIELFSEDLQVSQTNNNRINNILNVFPYHFICTFIILTLDPSSVLMEIKESLHPEVSVNIN